jgi:hypothetical protein
VGFLSLLLLSSGKLVVQQCARESTEEAEFTAERCAGLCEACVESFLECALLSGSYAFAVACLRLV